MRKIDVMIFLYFFPTMNDAIKIPKSKNKRYGIDARPRYLSLLSSN